MVHYFKLIFTVLVTVYSYSTIITVNDISQEILQKTNPRQNQNNLKLNQFKPTVNQNRLNQLRKIMKQNNIDVYILPRTDQNLNQYICEQDQRLQFLFNYHGTYIDIAVVTKNQAQMWTTNITGQIFSQQGWKIKNVKNNQTWAENLLENFMSKMNVQIDARLISATQVRILKALFEDSPITINFSERNLVDQIWINKPQPKRSKIYLHQKWAGRTMSEKVNWVRDKIKTYQGDAALFGDLGQISWILNLRSSQFTYTPYFKSYLLITLEGGTLHLPNGHPTINDIEIKDYLRKQNIQIKQFNFLFPKKILTQPSTINYWMFSKIEKPIGWEGIGMLRAIRTDKQIQSFKKSNLRDGVVMVKFWAWLASQESVNEYDAANYLDNLRKESQNNMGISFPTISAAGQNAALMHYIPNKNRSSMINKNKIFMVDSGGQYLEGTTDTTRTFHFGVPSHEEKDSYTRVLLGNLDLQRVIWRQYRMMTGQYLDRIARKYLSTKQLSYTHPTGHGVGLFGSVHEGPIGIGPGKIFDFRPNMIVTNQPGYYEPGKYGIRIQNMLVVIKKSQDDLAFQNLTLCPYSKNLLDRSLLKEKDIKYINNYHSRVWKQLSPLLKQDSQTLNWLKMATEPI